MMLRGIRDDRITLVMRVIVNIIGNLMPVWRNIVHQLEELGHGRMFGRIVDVERQTSLVDCSSEEVVQFLLPSLGSSMCERNCSFRHRLRMGIASLGSWPRWLWCCCWCRGVFGRRGIVHGCISLESAIPIAHIVQWCRQRFLSCISESVQQCRQRHVELSPDGRLLLHVADSNTSTMPVTCSSIASISPLRPMQEFLGHIIHLLVVGCSQLGHVTMKLGTLLQMFDFPTSDTTRKAFVLAVSALHHCLLSCAFDLVELHGCVALWSWHFAGMYCRLPGNDRTVRDIEVSALGNVS